MSAAFHVNNLDDWFLARGWYPLKRSGRYLRYRDLWGAVIRLPVAVGQRTIPQEEIDTLSARIADLAQRHPAPLVTPASIMHSSLTDTERRVMHRASFLASAFTREGYLWNWRDAQHRGWFIVPDTYSVYLWQMWCELQSVPCVTGGGYVTGDIRHLVPADDSARYQAIAGRVYDAFMRKYLDAFGSAEMQPGRLSGDGVYLTRGGLTALETCAIAGILLDVYSAVLREEGQP